MFSQESRGPFTRKIQITTFNYELPPVSMWIFLMVVINLYIFYCGLWGLELFDFNLILNINIIKIRLYMRTYGIFYVRQ